RIDIEPVDEGGRVSLFEMISMKVVQVHVKHVLDYVFYHDGGRRLPTTIIIGASVFDEPGGRTVQPAVSNSAHNAAETRVSNELVDSDEDSDDSLLIPRVASATTTMRGARKRDRDPDTDEQSGNPPARHCNDAGSRAGLPAMALIETAPAVIEGRGQFWPTRMQTTVHLSIVNGTYSLMGAQFFLERLQSQIGLLAFLPHPAVLKGFYAWEFGTRGLSVMHFGRLDMSSRRRAFGELDMCDFSSRNSLPRPIHARSLDNLISAIDCLALLVGDVYQSFVGNVVAAARQFFLHQKAFASTFDEDALRDLVYWTNERFERLRNLLVLGSQEQCESIRGDFNVAQESYVQLNNGIQQRQLAQLTAHRDAVTSIRSGAQPREHRDNGSTQTKRVPDQVLRALPAKDGKKLCMKHLANHSCRGNGADCVHSYRGHFKPQNLPNVVRNHIEANYGGLKAEFKDI
ncbi:hypothetical protein BBJ28_00023005, partial [Nothophytophthora sp. Chile5]